VGYLFARTKARSTDFIEDWEALAGRPERIAARYGESGPEAVTRALAREYRWAWESMDAGLRERFWRFFFTLEQKTIFICLRYRAVQAEGERAAAALADSLLGGEIKGILLSEEPLPSVLSHLEETLSRCMSLEPPLGRAFSERGLMGVERALAEGSLAAFAREKAWPGWFFSYLVDQRNLLSLHKHLRWQVGEPLTVLEGGSIPPPEIRRLAGEGSPGGVLVLARRLAGAREGGDLAALLLDGLLRRARRRAVASEEGWIFYYLLRRRVEAGNLRVLLRRGEGPLREGLVL
jgi:hypothetical protein